MRVTAQGISKDYFRQRRDSNVFTALFPTDMTVSEGEIAAVMGRSGSGKSTLLNILAGLLSPTAGKVTYDDADIFAMSDDERSVFRNKHIGVIPQVHTGLHSLNVRQNIMLPYDMYGEKCPDERIDELLEKLGLMTLADVYPDELSGGEMRRLSIARALVRRPDVILADEPTGDLDGDNTRIAMELLAQAAGNGACVLFVTHDDEAAAYAHKVYRMSQGRIE